MHWRLGTMGFGYPEWAGVFYPRGLKSGDWLAYYATHFDAVELDTTFHAVPDPNRVRRWATAVPQGFRFAVKTHKAITHEGTIDGRIELMRAFVDVVRNLGQKLGVILIQFPPGFGFSEFPRLAGFLGSLPADVRFAVEFRNVSWRRREAWHLLRDHRVAWVSIDYYAAPREVVRTTDFLYVRLLGERDRFPQKDHVQLDVTAPLGWWRDQIVRKDDRIDTAWVMFNNDYSGYSIETIRRFREMVGIPAPPTQPLPGVQGELFG